MRTLILLRHAKSEWGDASLDDHERPLAPRGNRDAPRMGAFLADQGLVPDIVLCSDAVRARETLTLVLSQLTGDAPEIEFDKTLYLAAPKKIMQRIGVVNSDVGTVMVVGHNPGFHDLARKLVGAGDRQQLVALAEKFPTAAMAAIEFDADHWADIEAGQGRLLDFATPKTI